MLADLSRNIGSGSLSSGIEVEESIKAVITFIRNNFKDFRLKNEDLKIENEKGINQKLCIFLNRRASKYPFFFHPDYMEEASSGNSPQIDIGTISRDEKIVISDKEYGEDDSFFSLEAKRLPTPGSNREREYVIGHITPCGAIERLKKGIHASRLKYAAIIGYIQDKDFEHWFLTINSWIDELVKEKKDLWVEQDKLRRTAIQDNPLTVELLSENLRRTMFTENDKIYVYHFWINLHEAG